MRRCVVFLAIGTAFVLLAGQGAAGGTLHVTNQGSGNLAVLDEASLTVRKVIPVGERPWGVAVTADGRAACVAHAAGLAFVDVDAGTVARQVDLGGEGMGGAGSLSAIDAKTFQELRRIPVGKDHEQVALSADGRRAYLTGGFALGGHDDLTVVDLQTGGVSRIGMGGKCPFAILRLP